MIITVLAENNSINESIGAQHGLSLYIETFDKKILFDMGQNSLFSENAEKLGVDLSEVDIAVISHGHYDHGGGLIEFLRINKKAPVYIHKNAFLPYYNGKDKYIGLDVSLADNERLVFNDEKLEITKGITLYSMNKEERIYDVGNFGLTVKKENGYAPDTFLHEQYLLIEEAGKRILFSGCSHKGAVNIAEWFRPDVFIGGFHFSKHVCNGELEKYAKILDSYGTTYYTCHCTGKEQFEFMNKYMRSLSYILSGESVKTQK